MKNQLLKFITCGSVDDGKSTLIGHMLYDAKLIFADQKKALELDSKLGSADGQLDYSLLLDGLMAEREQGITIDVAYRYFSTKKRSFIVADTPGHEEYTRNMAVGASFASLAVILTDASQGVLIQTKRHARICAMMGIRHFVFAVNKMDLVHYEKDRFEKIKKDIKVLMSEFEYETLQIIPVSAKNGDNVTEKSEKMPWYKKETLLACLENIQINEEQEDASFLLPIQRVCRPNHTFRGFQGEIAAGSVGVGDKVVALPSGEEAHVRAIYSGTKQVEKASGGAAVNIQLDREIDISRGCVLAKDPTCHVGSMFEADLLWMDDERLIRGKNYLLKIGTQTVPATVMNIQYRIDVNTGVEVPADSITKNEIAHCEISVGSRIVFDLFANSRELGSLILIDRITNMTSACGVVKKILSRDNNLTWHTMDINRKLREAQLGQKAKTIWLTGLSGAGKSTIANALEKKLFAMGRHTMLLDGDNVRMGLNRDLGFTESDRIENIRRIAEVARLMNDAGLIVITAFISPTRLDRRSAREIIGKDFVEVYINTPLAVCEKRDTKGLYQKARRGEIAYFTGITSAYEPPEQAQLCLDTSVLSPEECVDRILERIMES